MATTVKQRFIHMTARKLRRVAQIVKGQEANQALAHLSVLPLAAATPVAHAVKSALTAAEKNEPSQSHTIALIYVDEGPAMKRRIMKSRGRATRMEHRMSHLTVSLEPVTQEPSKRSRREKYNGS
jgi:large subunit ribosomal protein L22